MARTTLVPFQPGDRPATRAEANWLWQGYLARGQISLLTSLWKAGKTTLISGLLRAFDSADSFLSLPIARGSSSLILSEESPEIWQERQGQKPFGPNLRIISQPFDRRVTAEDWQDVLNHVVANPVDLFIIDPLASFLPGHSENNATCMLDALLPLRQLTRKGIAVLLLHHPRKTGNDSATVARGSGALTGFVDVNMELKRFVHGPDPSYRMLRSTSRRLATQAELLYKYDPATAEFDSTLESPEEQYRRVLAGVKATLENEKNGLPVVEILNLWSEKHGPICRSALYQTLKQAFIRKDLRRSGDGSKSDPFRYRLENEDDAHYDRGELPPIRPIDFGS